MLQYGVRTAPAATDQVREGEQPVYLDGADVLLYGLTESVSALLNLQAP